MLLNSFHSGKKLVQLTYTQYIYQLGCLLLITLYTTVTPPTAATIGRRRLAKPTEGELNGLDRKAFLNAISFFCHCSVLYLCFNSLQFDEAVLCVSLNCNLFSMKQNCTVSAYAHLYMRYIRTVNACAYSSDEHIESSEETIRYRGGGKKVIMLQIIVHNLSIIEWRTLLPSVHVLCGLTRCHAFLYFTTHDTTPTP